VATTVSPSPLQISTPAQVGWQIFPGVRVAGEVWAVVFGAGDGVFPVGVKYVSCPPFETDGAAANPDTRVDDAQDTIQIPGAVHRICRVVGL
jgi:hypothetical protein